MDGLQRLFLRITPIITLICFICLGITHIFAQNENDNITYLTQETITIDNNDTPNDTTDDITLKSYEFDFTSYRSNINANKIKQATTNVIQLNTLENTLSNFNLIWEDGYDPGDIIKTIGNAALLFINVNLVVINAVLMPIRIATSILITGMSILGININREQGIIIPFLNKLIVKLKIDLIDPTAEKTNPQYDTLNNTKWKFYEIPDIPNGTAVQIENIQFISNGKTFTSMYIQNTYVNSTFTYLSGITYKNETQTIKVYDGYWINNNYRTIEVLSTESNKYNQQLYNWLSKLAEEQTPSAPAESYDKEYLIQEYYLHSLNNSYILTIPFYINDWEHVDQNNNYVKIYFTEARFSNDTVIFIGTNGMNIIYMPNYGWSNPSNYRRIHIAQEYELTETQEQQLQTLLNIHVLKDTSLNP